MPIKHNYIEKEITVAATETISPTDHNEIYRIYTSGAVDIGIGNWTLSLNPNIPVDGMICEFRWECDLTTTGAVQILGSTMPTHLYDKQQTIKARYSGAAWVVNFLPDLEESNIITSDDIEDGTIVTGDISATAGILLTQLEALATGSIIRGVANVPTAYDVSTDTYMLIGDGTTVNSVAITGDITVTNAGVTTIGNDAVENGMINTNVVGDGLTGGSGSAIDVEPDVANGTSVAVTGDGVRLTGDSTAPGNDYFYGTDGAGTKGWYLQSAISSLWEAGTGTEAIQHINTLFPNDASGTYSFAVGYNATASGTQSVALINGTASGVNSMAVMGGTASANNSFAIGSGCHATEQYAVALNYGSTASGKYSLCVNAGNKTPGERSLAHGTSASACWHNSKAHGGHKWNKDGDAQAVDFVLKENTTNATPAILEIDEDTAEDGIKIPEDCTMSFEIMLVASETGGVSGVKATSFKQNYSGLLKNNGGASSLVGAIVASAPIRDAAFLGTAAVTVDIATDKLIITVTGENATDINWVAHVKMVMTGYGNFNIDAAH